MRIIKLLGQLESSSLKWETFLRIERWNTNNSQGFYDVGQSGKIFKKCGYLGNHMFLPQWREHRHTHAHTHTYPYTLCQPGKIVAPTVALWGSLTLKPHPHCNKMFPKGADRATQGHALPLPSSPEPVLGKWEVNRRGHLELKHVFYHLLFRHPFLLCARAGIRLGG